MPGMSKTGVVSKITYRDFHISPGRFFAVNELKAMMAYLILNYDIKAELEGVRPPNVYHAIRVVPNPKAKVLLKKRARA